MGDTTKTIICPACGSEMKKIFIADKGINIDICVNNCGGIFFDNQELQECSSPDTDLSEITQILQDKNFMPVDETKTRLCPACNTPMAKTKPFGVQIDTCYKCGGVFLDNKEFDKIHELIKPKKKRNEASQNQQYKDIDLHEFCKDALDEERQFNNFKNAVNLLTKNYYHRRFFRRFSKFIQFLRAVAFKINS